MPCLQRPSRDRARQRSPARLVHARDIALKAGLHQVYTGNMHNKEGDTTVCHATLIERDGYQIVKYRLTPRDHCPDCGTAVAGRFAAQAGNFGRKRIPLAINA